MKNLFIGILLLFAISACEKDEITLKSDNLLIGSWVENSYNDSTQTFVRVDSLADDAYGFSFDLDGNFIECKNIGWCGTPPISYGKYEGTYEQNDSIIAIEVPYWGGDSEYSWQIISLTDDELEIYWVDQEYHMDGEN